MKPDAIFRPGAVMASIIIHPMELVFEQIRAGGDRNFGTCSAIAMLVRPC
jgi:hypothetical protein